MSDTTIPTVSNLIAVFPDLTDNQARSMNVQLNSQATPDEILEYCNYHIEGYGIESLPHPTDSGQIIGLYVNMGDTYDTTIIWDIENNEYLITNCGTFLEEWERENPEFELSTEHDDRCCNLELFGDSQEQCQNVAIYEAWSEELNMWLKVCEDCIDLWIWEGEEITIRTWDGSNYTKSIWVWCECGERGEWIEEYGE